MATTSTSLSAQIQAAADQYGQTLTKPITALQNQKTLLSYRSTALNSIRTKMSALSTSTKAMILSGGTSKFNVYSVSSTLPNVASATASTGESVGTHTLLVSQLAKNDMAMSSRFTNTDTTISTAVGAATKQFQVSINGVDTPIDVTFDGTETNVDALKKIAAAVNAKATTSGVSASVVGDTSSTSKLVFTSQATGAASKIILSDLNGGNVLDSIGLTGAVLSGRTASTAATAGYTYTDSAALDSKFTLDGIEITRSGNTVSDALPGMTFTLKSVQQPADTPIALTVGLDKDTIKSNVQDFLTKYNDLITVVRSQTEIDVEAKTRQILSEDSTYVQLRTSLRMMVSGEVSTVASGSPSSLSAIGITADDDGKLSITNADKFNAVLAGANATTMADLFTSSGGIATQMKRRMDDFLNTGGIMQTSTRSITDRTKAIDKKIADYQDRNARKVEQYKTDLAKIQTLLTQLSTQTSLASSYVAQVSAG